MARGKRTKSRAGALDARAVADGTIEVGVRELLELVHRVNPTERGLDPAEERRRYQLKSRLQSLLVRRFGDELVIEAEPSGAIALRHRYGAGDACHAIVDELDADARAYVQRQLDERAWGGGQPEPAAPVVGASEASDDEDGGEVAATEVGEQLRAAAAALEAYDYDAARALLTRELARSGSATAAIALLELLVDHLGADEDALLVGERLRKEALAVDRTRLLLAVAAARLGQGERARELVRKLRDPLVADVHLTLARRALEREQVEEITRALADARRLDPTHVEAVRIEQRLEELRGRLLAPLEERLEKCWAEEAYDEAQRAADEILARAPESRTARRISALLAQRRDRERAHRLVEEADEAERRGALAEAAAHLELASRLGAAEFGDLGARVAELARKAREQAAALALEELRRTLADDERDGLLAYVALAPEVRERARRELDLPAFDPLEQLQAASTRARARAAVDAILALDRARALLDREPERVEPLLAPHERLLGRLDDARRLLADARGRVALARGAEVRQRIELARRALDAGDLEAVEAELEGSEGGALPGQDRAEIAALRDQVSRRRRALELEEQLNELERQADPFSLLAARRTAAKLAAIDGDRWRSRQRDLGEAVGRAWRLEIFVDDEAELLHPWRHQLYLGVETPPLSLSPDGTRAYLVSRVAGLLFVWELCALSGKTERLVTLRAPRGAHVETVVVDEDTLRIAGDAWLLELALPDYEIARFEDVAWALPDGETCHGLLPLPAPHGGTVWLATEHPQGRAGRLLVVDLDRRRVTRTFHRRDDVLVVVTEDRVRVSANGYLLEPLLCEARGGPLRGHHAEPDLCGVYAADPTDAGLLMLAYERPWDDDEEEVPLELRRHGGEGGCAPYLLADSHYELVHCLATSSECGLAFVEYASVDRRRLLTALRPQNAAIEHLYTVPSHPDTLLVRDCRGRRVVLLQATDSGIGAVKLGSTAPSAVADALPELPSFNDLCWGYDPSPGPEERTTLAALAALPPAEIAGWIERRRPGEEAAHLWHLVDLLGRKRRDETEDGTHEERAHLGRELEAWLYTHRRDDPVVLGKYLDELHVERRFPELAAMAGTHAAVLDPARRHACHLVGMALYRLGEVDAARAIWREGLAHEGRCQLEELLQLPPTGEDEATPVTRAATLLFERMAAADEALEAQRPAEAIVLLRHPQVAHAREVQSLARLAQAYLDARPERRAERTHMLLSLDSLVKIGGSLRRAPELPPPGRGWEAERLQAVVARAERWVEEEG